MVLHIPLWAQRSKTPVLTTRTGAGRMLFWRLPLLAVVSALAIWKAPSAAGSLILCLPFLSGMLAFHLFQPAVLRRWLERGYLLGADVLLVTLILLGVGSPSPLTFVGFSGSRNQQLSGITDRVNSSILSVQS